MHNRLTAFVKTKGGDDDGLLTYIRPFTIPMWLLVLLTFILTSGTYFAIAQIGKHVNEEDDFDLGSSVMISVHGLLLQGAPDEPSRCSLRIAFLTVFLAGVILQASYSSCLISFLAVKVMQLPFTDEETLLSSDFKIVTVPGITSDHFRVSCMTLQ